MELYEDILLYKLNNLQNIDQLADLLSNASSVITDECYQTLKKIKAVIEDDNLSDPECFAKIEQIIRLFEEIGSNGGNRHDFS